VRVFQGNPDTTPTPTPRPSFAQVAAAAEAATRAPPKAAPKTKYFQGFKPTRQAFGETSLFRTHSAFAIMADFGGFNASPTQALEVINSQFTDVETLKFLKQGRVAEIGFLSREAVRAALDHGLSLEERSIPLTRCYTLKASIIQVTIRGLPCFSKEETKEAIQEAFAPHGVVQEVQFHFYPRTTIRMDSAVALLETPRDSTPPRRLSVLGVECDLFWRGAGPFCYYCKGAGHWVTACERLAKRKKRSTRPPSQPSPLSPPLPPLPPSLPLPPPTSPMLVPTPLAEQSGSTLSLKRPVGTRPMADTPEHSFILEETPPLERRRKKKAKGKQRQEPRKEPSPPPVLGSGESSPLVSPMHVSPNPSDDEVVLAPVNSPVPFGPPLPPGFKRLDRDTTPPPLLTPRPSLLNPEHPLFPLDWSKATPPGTPYDPQSAVDIELSERLERVYSSEEIEEMREEIAVRRRRIFLENEMDDEEYKQYIARGSTFL
jgi:hypothetical protein